MKRFYGIFLCILPLAAADVIKEGLYKSLGFGLGYYYYGEWDQVGAPFMHTDEALFGIVGNLGYAKNGIKVEVSADASFVIGLYTGSVLDSSNPDLKGKPLKQPTSATIYHGEFKAGYDLLSHFFGASNATLYAQAGVGYRFYRDGFLSMVRHQGYLYVPLEIEGEVRLGRKLGLEYLLGYNYLVFGDHKSLASQWHFSEDLIVKQDSGFGLKSFVGLSFKTKSENINTIRLVYEFWSIAASPSSAFATSSVTGSSGYLYEPRNKTHTITLQYLYSF
ncbi:hypothetical protein [uncultured Helicobacter sp.]|uniref:hypothetical protein n=1 Tax=uncultured Helicobacter sp. TaxID=175537 RepID=UPI0037520EBF